MERANPGTGASPPTTPYATKKPTEGSNAPTRSRNAGDGPTGSSRARICAGATVSRQRPKATLFPPVSTASRGCPASTLANASSPHPQQISTPSLAAAFVSASASASPPPAMPPTDWCIPYATRACAANETLAGGDPWHMAKALITPLSTGSRKRLSRTDRSDTKSSSIIPKVVSGCPAPMPMVRSATDLSAPKYHAIASASCGKSDCQ